MSIEQESGREDVEETINRARAVGRPHHQIHRLTPAPTVILEWREKKRRGRKRTTRNV